MQDWEALTLRRHNKPSSFSGTSVNNFRDVDKLLLIVHCPIDLHYTIVFQLQAMSWVLHYPKHATLQRLCCGHVLTFYLVVVSCPQINHDMLQHRIFLRLNQARQQSVLTHLHTLQILHNPAIQTLMWQSNLETLQGTCLISEEEHGRAWIVQLIHGIEVWHFCNIYKIHDCKVLALLWYASQDLQAQTSSSAKHSTLKVCWCNPVVVSERMILSDACSTGKGNDLVHLHASGIPIVTKSEYDNSILLLQDI